MLLLSHHSTLANPSPFPLHSQHSFFKATCTTAPETAASNMPPLAPGFQLEL